MNRFRECSSYGALYTTSFGYSKGGFCAKCGNQVDGHYCRHCALLRKKLKEVWFKICNEQNSFQDILNTSESSNDDSNVVNAPQEPIVLNEEPREDSSQSPPKFERFSFFKTPKVLLLAWDRVSEIKNAVGNKQYKPEDVQELFRKLLKDVQNIHEELAEYINIPSWNCPAFSIHDDDDENFTIAITPEQPDNSLSIGEEHLDTISATESDKVINSSVEDLIPIPSEYEGIPDNMCDVLFRDNYPPLDVSEDQLEEFYDSNDDSTLIDDDYFSIDNIDYIELSPPDSKLDGLEEVKDDNLREKLMNINLLIAKIKSLNDNPTPDHVLKSPIPVKDSDSFLEKFDTSLSYSDSSLPEFKTFSNHTEEKNSGSTTTHADYSLSKYNSFLFEIQSDQGELTSVVILAEHRVHKNSGSTTIHADISLSDLECFNFKRDPEPGELTSTVNFGIRENILSTTNSNLPPEDDHSSLFSYAVWIFLYFLTYLMIPLYLLSFENEDTIFDPGIANYHFPSLLPDVSHQSGTFMKFNVYPNHLNEIQCLSTPLPSPRTNELGDWVKLSDPKQALHGRHPMLILN
nr:hypothetical protein [Tanacetum cinerariifolium]